MTDSIRPLQVLSVAAFGALLADPLAFAAERDDTAITIYSSARPGGIPADLYRPLPGSGVPSASSIPGYALVRQDRTLNVPAGRSTLKFTDVAALIDPTTVTFASLSDTRTRVLEQSYQFDLVSTDKLLLKFINQPITIERAVGNDTRTLSGTLLSAVDGLVLQDKDGSLHAVRNYEAIRFPELPQGLDTKPTLVWDVQTAKGGEQQTRVTYQTGGITWWADYNLVFNEGKDANQGVLDLSAWVSIINQSGATYPNARLKLIAGDVNRVKSSPAMRQRAVPEVALAAAAGDAAGFEQKSFFEFHLYTLGRRTTLPNNSTRQIELFDEARKIPARRQLVYVGTPVNPFGYDSPMTERSFGVQSNKKVDVYLEFRNEKQHGLGMPLPAGRIRVSKLDTADNSLEFIGEDAIDHTPKDENVRIRLGSSFDVVGERKQLDYAVDTRAHWIEEEVELKLRNHRDQPVEVVVQESLYRWTNWKMLSNTHQYTKEDARTVHFPVTVPKDGETTVRYRVRYSW